VKLIHKEADPRDAGQVIEIVEVHFCYAGGGLLHKVPLADVAQFFADHLPFDPDTVQWRRRRFNFDDESVYVEGWTDGRRWNGWHCPLIEAHQVDSFNELVSLYHLTAQPDGTLLLEDAWHSRDAEDWMAGTPRIGWSRRRWTPSPSRHPRAPRSSST
jgi:hypothetical protein